MIVAAVLDGDDCNCSRSEWWSPLVVIKIRRQPLSNRLLHQRKWLRLQLLNYNLYHLLLLDHDGDCDDDTSQPSMSSLDC